MATLELTRDGTFKYFHSSWDCPPEDQTKSKNTLAVVDYKDGVLALPNTVTAVGEYVLRECRTLKKIILPPSVKAIHRGAFKDCKNLAEVVFSAEVETIGHQAFCGCSALTTVQLPWGLVKIGEEAFGWCTSLQHVDWGNNLRSIGKGAFVHCAFSCVTLPEGLVEIGEDAFSACPNLACVNIPASLQKMGSGAFVFCPNLNQVNTDGNNFSYNNGYLVDNTCMRLQLAGNNTVVPNGIQIVGKFAFYQAVGQMKKLAIPNSVKRIEERAFTYFDVVGSVKHGLSAVEEIQFGSGLEYIGYGAFEQLYKLRKIHLPNGLKEIDEAAFWDCRSATELHLPEGLQKIGCMAFANCSNLTKVQLPAGIKTLGKRAFGDCNKLALADFAGAPKTIESSIFAGCTALKHVNIANGVETIAAHAFENCSALQTVTLPPSVKHIGEQAFYKTGLTGVTLPPQATVDVFAFALCHNLVSVNIQSQTKLMLGVFYGCNNIAEVAVSPQNPYCYLDSGCVIAKGAKRLLLGNPTCHLPEGVEILDDYAYTNCTFKKIYLPATLKKIAINAFDECYDLQTVHFAGTLAQWCAIDLDEDEYWSLQAYGDHEDFDGTPYWFFLRSHCKVICTDGVTYLD